MATGEKVRDRYTDLVVEKEKGVSTDLEEEQKVAKRKKSIKKNFECSQNV